MRKKKGVSLNDIAQSLGVSRSLVSLVLNGKGQSHGIAQKTCEIVLEKAKELNYYPNHFARGLRMGRSYTIGLVVSDISNPFYSHISRHLEDLSEANGYSLITCSSDEKPEKEKRLIDLLKSRNVDGLIISTSQETVHPFLTLKAEGFPLVLIDRHFEGNGICSVTVDNFLGAKAAANHILQAGYKKPIALAISPIHISTIHNRIEGYKAALSEAGVWPRVFEVAFENQYETVAKIFELLYTTNQFPDSIFAMNNSLTAASLAALRNLGVSIPQQMGIVSFDDLDYFAIMQPGITSVAQPIKGICKTAFSLLTNQIEGLPVSQNCIVSLPVELIERESTSLAKIHP
jgi:LacI family transcriptional regulator